MKIFVPHPPPPPPPLSLSLRLAFLALFFLQQGHGNWMYSEREWLGSYNERTDIPGPNEELTGTIVDFWDTDKPASHLNGTGYEEYLFRDRMLKILDVRFDIRINNTDDITLRTLPSMHPYRVCVRARAHTHTHTHVRPSLCSGHLCERVSPHHPSTPIFCVINEVETDIPAPCTGTVSCTLDA